MKMLGSSLKCSWSGDSRLTSSIFSSAIY